MVDEDTKHEIVKSVFAWALVNSFLLIYAVYRQWTLNDFISVVFFETSLILFYEYASMRFKRNDDSDE